MNIEAKYITSIATELLSKAGDFHFKFSTSDARVDVLLIYTSYEKVEEIINFVKTIISKHPEFFKNYDRLPVTTQTLKGCKYIGFGEEPVYFGEDGKMNSLNLARSAVIRRYIDKFGKDKLSKIYIDAIKKNKTYTYDDRKITIKEYIKNVIRKRLICTLNSRIERNRKGLIKENKILLEELQKTPNKRLDELTDMVVSQILNGNISQISLNYKEISNGESTDKLMCKLDVSSHLMNFCGVFELSKSIDEKALREACEECHVSYDYSYLNSETEEEMIADGSGIWSLLGGKEDSISL